MTPLNRLIAISHELYGLVVDDGILALAALVWTGAVWTGAVGIVPGWAAVVVPLALPSSVPSAEALVVPVVAA